MTLHYFQKTVHITTSLEKNWGGDNTETHNWRDAEIKGLQNTQP